MDGTPSPSARIKTGIIGLDNMLFGGIPEKSQVIIAGGPGTGKTLMSLEVLYNNAKAGIPCAFISVEEQSNVLINNFKEAFPIFADIDELIKENKLIVTGQTEYTKFEETTELQAYTNFGKVVAEIEKLISTYHIQCLVIDSISLLMMNLSNQVSYRRLLVSLVEDLRRFDVTTIMTFEVPTLGMENFKFSEEFFIFDGVIVMYGQENENKRQLTLEIIKMRGTEHSWSLSPYEITEKGFKVFTIEA